MTLQLPDFPAFVRAVFGYEPFPWQSDYLHAVADGAPWPDLDVPTGLGKTSLIDIWAFLLAWQADQGRQRTVPLRLFFVVDRRLVVDQAHRHAQQLQGRLEEAEARTLVGRVAAALRRLGGEEAPLEVVRMRGGVDWASRWLRSAAQPAVVTATVDQYGSRLLFRGYHTSPRMRPIDAALCGMDALLAVDEAHIALPLLTTAADSAAYQATATEPGLAHRAVRVVSLSATATADPARPRAGISDRDRHHPIAGARLKARRRLTLLDAHTWAKNSTDAFAQAANLAIDALLPTVARPVIGVVANTIATARATHQTLAARGDADVVLLIGRSRGADREHLLSTPQVTELLDGVTKDRKRPLLVVATQTIEVGLDVTVAALVTEASSAASMIQRLGRLDRKGEHALAPAIVVRAAAPPDPADIPVYGGAAARTWDWLAAWTDVLHGPRLTPDAVRQALPGGLLVNPTTLPTLLAGIDPQALNAPPPRIPVLHRTLLDSWTRTDPAPVPDQPTAPFLHGLNTSPEDVHVLWRADLPTNTEGRPDWARWADRLTQTPPHPGETVAVPARQLRRFLTRPGPATEGLSDLEGTAEPDPPDTAAPRRGAMAPALRWDGTDDATPITALKDIRPGSTVVLPSAWAGHDAYGWTGTLGPAVPDLGDFPPRPAAATTRIDAAVLANLADLDAPHHTTLAETITAAITQLETPENDQPPTAVVHHLVDRLLDHLPQPPAPKASPGRFTDRLRARLAQLRQVPHWDLTTTARAPRTGHVVIDGPDRLLLTPHQALVEPAPGVGDEDADTSSLTRQVPLDQHGKAVAARAAAYATRLNLPDPLTRAIETAAEAHDCGKAHPRFQTMLCAGDRLLAESLPAPLAKSGMDPADLRARRRAARLAGWNPKLRHEALSAAAVRQWLTTSPQHTEGTDPELIIHLVAAHHGRSRPLLPPIVDDAPVEVACTMPDGCLVTADSASMGVDWDGPDRFAALNLRYGPWGLALLEALVRLADMACSEEGS